MDALSIESDTELKRQIDNGNVTHKFILAFRVRFHVVQD